VKAVKDLARRLNVSVDQINYEVQEMLREDGFRSVISSSDPTGVWLTDYAVREIRARFEDWFGGKA
jgi:hypothetical protein